MKAKSNFNNRIVSRFVGQRIASDVKWSLSQK